MNKVVRVCVLAIFGLFVLCLGVFLPWLFWLEEGALPARLALISMVLALAIVVGLIGIAIVRDYKKLRGDKE